MNGGSPISKCSPKPANEQFTIKVPEGTDPTHRVILYDVLGNVRARGKFEGQEQTFNTNELNSGVYTIYVDGYRTGKLLIIK